MGSPCRGLGKLHSQHQLTLFVPPIPFWTMLKLKTNCSEAHYGARHSESIVISVNQTGQKPRSLRDA